MSATSRTKIELDGVNSLLSHLDAQEAAMLAVRSLLMDVSDVSGDENQQRQLRTRIDAASDLCSRLRNDSVVILQKVAEQLNCSMDDFSIRKLITAIEPQSPSLAESLRQARRRLLRLTWQLNRISASTAWILSEEQSIRSQLTEYLGGAVSSDRYTAHGRKRMTPESVRYGARS